MEKLAREYFNSFNALSGKIEVTGKNKAKLDLFSGIDETCRIIKAQAEKGKKVMFIGNGGSAAIASHFAIDFWKNGGIRSQAFNDDSLLTCIGNDYGFEHVFEKPIEMFADEGDILFAISSSGKSENILKGVQAAAAKKCRVVTFSGFGADNPLRGKGEINFYVPSAEYGPVEAMHHLLCHCIFDVLMKKGAGK